jgi:uncharacterized oxidoreductase
VKTTGNTIFITSATSGIGCGFAEAFDKLGNTVIISGQRKANLDEITAANPGMAAIELDITDRTSIVAAAARLMAEYPKPNVLINNAGIGMLDGSDGEMDEALMLSTIETNFIGPVRMTSALIEHLKRQHDSVIAYTGSWLGFTPLSLSAVYSATRAAVHSFAMPQRFMLRNSGVRVVEIVPPWTRTDMFDSREAEDAMPLDKFIAETMQILGTDVNEVVVDAAKLLRNAVGPNEQETLVAFNNRILVALGLA